MSPALVARSPSMPSQDSRPSPAPRLVRSWRHQFPVYSPLSGRALLAGARAGLRSARHGRTRERLLELLADRYRPKAVLLTDSGTAALTAALIGVLRERPGSMAALPAFSCYDVATAALGADAPVVLYDTDPRTLGPALSSLQAALRRGPAVVVAVHLYGCPVDLAEVHRLAAAAGAIVIEDAAQAAGAALGARPVGTQGSLAVLSFGRGKGLTGGSGGALLAYDEDGVRALEHVRGVLREPARGWRDLCALTAQLFLLRPNLYRLPVAIPGLRLGQTIYQVPRPLRGATAVSCGVVAATWGLAERELATRRRHATSLLRALGRQRALQTIQTPQAARPGYLRLPVLASPEARQLAVEGRARALGVMPSYPKTLCDLEGFAARCVNRGDAFPGSRLLAARLCTLPTHSRLGIADLKRLEQWIDLVGRR